MKRLISIIIVRGGSSVIALFSTMIIVRVIGASEAGVFFKNYAYALFLSTVIGFGLNSTILKYYAEYKDNPFGILIYIILEVFKIGFPLFLLAYIYSEWLCNIYSLDIIFLVSITFTISQCCHYFLMANKMNIKAYIFHNWIPNLMLILLISFNKNTSLLHVLFYSYVISIFLFILSYWRLISKRFNLVNIKNWNERINYFQQDILGQVFTSLLVIVSASIISDRDVSLLAIYQKITSVCNILISLFNHTYYPDMLTLIKEDKVSDFKRLMKKNYIRMILLIIVYSFLLFILWGKVKEYFVLDDLNYGYALLLLVAYVFVSYSNVSTLILNATGHSSVVRKCSWITVSLGLLFVYGLGTLYGLIGIISSLAIMLISQALLTRILLLKVI